MLTVFPCCPSDVLRACKWCPPVLFLTADLQEQLHGLLSGLCRNGRGWGLFCVLGLSETEGPLSECSALLLCLCPSPSDIPYFCLCPLVFGVSHFFASRSAVCEAKRKSKELITVRGSKVPSKSTFFSPSVRNLCLSYVKCLKKRNRGSFSSSKSYTGPMDKDNGGGLNMEGRGWVGTGRVMGENGDNCN